MLKRTGRMSLKELMCGEGDGESRAMERLWEAAIGLGSDCAKEDPRLPGDMNLETRSAEPSFSQRWPSSCSAHQHMKTQRQKPMISFAF